MADRIDPVSGNEVPPGATPENVRDDVPIMASEGEYVIPGNVVRYLGLKTIEKMVSDAKEALGDLDKGGRMGGEEDDDSLPFSEDELEWDDDETGEKYADGGLVTNNAPANDIREYKTPDGQSAYIPFFNGQPLYPVPEGYTEASKQPSSQSKPPNQQGIDPISGRKAMSSDADENGAFVEQNRSNLSRSPNEWTVDDFVSFNKQGRGAGDLAGRALTAMLPMGKIAYGLRERELNNRVPELMDQMLDTGVDLQGNPLSTEQRASLTTAKNDFVNQMSEDSGLSLNPLEKLGNIINKVKSFTGTDFVNPVKSTKGESTGAPRSSLNEEATKMVNNYSSSDDKYSGGDYGLGEDLGRDPNSGPSKGSMASGGLYKKGGLIARR